ncbi:MAG: RNA-binding protein [Bacillota bacterium]
MDLYQHFRPEERSFVDHVLDMRDRVEQQFITLFTDFLDPREAHIFESIIGNDDRFNIARLFGQNQLERTMYALSPYYESVEDEGFPVCLLEATYPIKFIDIKHPDVLGSFLSLGIDRKKLGDVTIDETTGTIRLLVHQDIAPFVLREFTQIKKAQVMFAEATLSTYQPHSSTWTAHQTTVSSLRLDVLIKEMYQMSRKDAKTLIEREWVKVNFKVVDSPAFTVEPNDLISVRKRGRSRLASIEGQTKKEKWRILYQRLVQ